MPLLTKRLTVRLHPKQLAFRQSQAFYRGFVGGRGSGKSWVGAYDLLRRSKPGRTYLVGSPTGVLLQDTTFPTLKAIAQQLGLWDPRRVRVSPYPNVELTTGAMLRFRSLENPERARGPNLSGIWLDEASLMQRAAYEISIACLREGGEQGWLSLTFTPKGLTHWTHEILAGEEKKPNTELFRAHTKENPFNPRGFAQTLAEQYSPRLARQELGGEFLDLEGAEWPSDYFDGMFFDEWPDVSWLTKAGAVDPSKGKRDKSGDYSALVWGGVDPSGVLWVDADLDQSRTVEPSQASGGRSIVEDILAAHRDWRPGGWLIETNGFQEWVARRAVDIAAQRRITLPVYAICNKDPKVGRIRTLTPYLAQRRLRVRNSRGGRLLVQQLRDFPVGEHDDGPDALKGFEVMADWLINGPEAQGGVTALAA